MTQGYIIMRGGHLWFLDEDGLLSIAENKVPPSLFISYSAARNAARRTIYAFKKLPHGGPNVKTGDFKIIRLEVVT